MARSLNVKATDYSPQFAQYLKSGFKKSMFKHLIGALDALAASYQKAWVAYAYGHMTVPGKKTIHSSGPYARSIQIDNSKPFERVIFTDYPPHRFIEEGHPEIDLKPGLLSGKSARQGKDGPYNIVSFRHGTQTDFHGIKSPPTNRGNVMPIRIQRLMRAATQRADQEQAAGLRQTGGVSRQLTSGPRPQDRSYQWGARLDNKLQTGRRSRLHTGYTWKSGKYAGMVRMEASSGPRESRTQYRTFRVVSIKSDPRSWIVPPQEPIPIRQAVIDFVDENVPIHDMIRDAIMKDIT